MAVVLADSLYVVGCKQIGKGGFSSGTILQHFDLKERGLAWHEGLTPSHLDCIKEIKDLMLRS